MTRSEAALGFHIKAETRKPIPAVCVDNCPDIPKIDIKIHKIRNPYMWKNIEVKTPLTPFYQLDKIAGRERVVCGGGGTSDEAFRRARRKIKIRQGALYGKLVKRRQKFGDSFNLERFIKNTKYPTS